MRRMYNHRETGTHCTTRKRRCLNYSCTREREESERYITNHHVAAYIEPDPRMRKSIFTACGLKKYWIHSTQANTPILHTIRRNGPKRFPFRCEHQDALVIRKTVSDWDSIHSLAWAYAALKKLSGWAQLRTGKVLSRIPSTNTRRRPETVS